jgi:inner membrane transporter RhtA
MSDEDSNNDCVARAAGRGESVGLARGIPPEFLAIGSMLSVQLGAALAVPVMATIEPVATTALRLFWAGIILVGIVRPGFRTMTGRQWLVACGLGIVIAVLTLCYFAAISRIPMGPATAIEFLGPLGVALAGTRRLRHLVLAAVAAIGVLLLTREHSHWSVDLGGVGFAAVAASGWAAYIILMKRVGASFPGLQGLSIALLVAAMVAMPVNFLAKGNVLTVAPFLSTIGLALLSPLLPYTLEMMALRSMGTRAFGIFMSMEPAISAILGYAILAQRLSLRQICGIGCVVAASAITAAESRNG